MKDRVKCGEVADLQLNARVVAIFSVFVVYQIVEDSCFESACIFQFRVETYPVLKAATGQFCRGRRCRRYKDSVSSLLEEHEEMFLRRLLFARYHWHLFGRGWGKPFLVTYLLTTVAEPII